MSSRARAREIFENPCPCLAGHLDVHQLVRFVVSLRLSRLPPRIDENRIFGVSPSCVIAVEPVAQADAAFAAVEFRVLLTAVRLPLLVGAFYHPRGNQVSAGLRARVPILHRALLEGN